MAVVNTKSNAITNADATPLVKSARTLTRAPLFAATATVEVAAADSDGSVFRMVRLPSNAVVYKIDVLNDAITSGTDYDFGLYKTAADGGAVVDADAFASAVDLSSARVAPLDITHEALNIDKVEKRLFEVATLTTDPNILYDLCFTANTVGSAAGTISVVVYYSV